MQALCASQEFSGIRGPDGPNFAGSCSGGEVIFKFNDANFRTIYHLIKYLRNRLECRTRCFCNHGLEDPKEQPKYAPLSRASFPGPNRNAGGSSVHVIKVEKRGHEAIPQTGWVTPVTRFFEPELNYPARTNDVGIAVTNKIECTGPLPDFDLPAPFRVVDFANNQELCAVPLSGGSL